MKACRYHDPDYLSEPEAFANALCRGSGPPNEQRRPGGGGAETVSAGGVKQYGKPTARERIEQLAALYGKGGAS